MIRRFAKLLTLGYLLSVFCPPALATPTTADYGALESTQMVAISPNGETIAYRKVENSQDTVVIYSLKERKLLSAFDVSSVQPQQVYFLNDNQLFLRASRFGRTEGYVGKFEISTGFTYSIAEKKIRQLLIPGDGILKGQMGLGNVVGLTPDNQYVLMPAYADVGYIIPTPDYSLFKVDLTRKKINKVLQGDPNTTDYFVDASGEVIAQEIYESRTNTHRIRAQTNGKWVDIFSEKAAVRTKNFVGVTPDFKSLVFSQADENTGHFSFNTMSLTDGKISTGLLSSPDLDVDRPLSNLQRVVQGVIYEGFSPKYKFFDESLDKKVNNIIAQFPEHSVYLSNWTPDWKHIVVRVEGSNHAGDYYLFSDTKEPIFLTSSRNKITQDDINPIGNVTFTARDGLKIPTLITIPKTKMGSMKNLPAIVLPHGGPASHDRIEFDFLSQALANQGYLVIQPQFRGSTGFGYKFRDAGHGEWGKKMQDDVSDSVAFFSKKGIIDPSKVCIVGWSYGGYAALVGGSITPELYKCVVSINGVSDLNAMQSYVEFNRGSQSEAADYWKMQFGNGELDKMDLAQVSPANNAKKFTAPVLLIYGENDQIVPPIQSETIYKRLKDADKNVEQVKIEGDDHHLQKGSSRVQALDALITFVNKNLKP